MYCRAEPLASLIREVFLHLQAHDIPFQDWGRDDHWVAYLPENDIVDPRTAAKCCRQAISQSLSDWRVERQVFHRAGLPFIEEDWAWNAWDDPWSPSADARSSVLDARANAPFGGNDFAVYGDGGHNGKVATFCSQPRSFGAGSEYWLSSESVTEKMQGALPRRYGLESTTVHTAEMVSMVNAMRWCQPGHWNLAVFDRSALFHALTKQR
jgi:hypothetical protein